MNQKIEDLEVKVNVEPNTKVMQQSFYLIPVSSQKPVGKFFKKVTQLWSHRLGNEYKE